MCESMACSQAGTEGLTGGHKRLYFGEWDILNDSTSEENNNRLAKFYMPAI